MTAGIMTRRSRRLIWLVAAVLVLGGGYVWYRNYVAEQFGAVLNNWILARTAEGYRIDADIAPESGDLTAVRRKLSEITISAPDEAWELKIPSLAITVYPLHPFSVQFHPVGRVDLKYTIADADYEISNTILGGLVNLGYDKSGRVTSVNVGEAQGKFEGPMAFEFVWMSANARFHPEASSLPDAKSAELNFALEDMEISAPSGLPLGQRISRLDLDAYVAGAIQSGRPSESLAAWRDAGGVLQMQRFVANWGPLAITAEGTLALDGQMQPLFAGTASLRGYGEAIDALVQAGMIESGQATGAKIALAAMTKPGDDGGPPAAKVPITIQDGFLFVGPLKLAAMPRIVWQ